MRERVTIGCLVLLNVVLLVPFVVAAYLWISFERAERENERRREAAADSLLERARDTADRTADALTASRDTGTDALLEVIWKHTESPVIAHDEDRRVFTAVISRAGGYDPEPMPFGVTGEFERCFAHTYARRPGPGWTGEVAERDRSVCEGSERVGGRVRSARRELEGLAAGRLTRDGLQEALDADHLPSEESRSEVRDVVRTGRTVVALVLFRERYWTPDEAEAEAEQCYRLTRVLVPGDPYAADDPGGGTGESVTAVPVAAC